MSMAAARKSLKATIAVMPWKSVFWIVHVSLAGSRRFTFAMVIVGVWLMRGCRRLFGTHEGMLVWGRVVDHRSCRIAISVRPYAAGENVGRLTTCA